MSYHTRYTGAMKPNRATSTRRTKRGATIQERKRRDGTITRVRTNSDGSTRRSRRTAGGVVKSATRRTAPGRYGTGSKVKSMMRGGKTYGKSSNRVARQNSTTEATRIKRMDQRKRTRQAAAATRRTQRQNAAANRRAARRRR